MALAFGVEFDPEDRGAPRFAMTVRRPSSAPPWARQKPFFMRDWFENAARAPARVASKISAETIRRENASLADAFGRIAARVGVTEAERAVLLGAARDPSRLIMALETISAAVEWCGAPGAALDWLRAEIQQAPFNGRAPLALIAEGQLGAEIALIFLRARLRKAMV